MNTTLRERTVPSEYVTSPNGVSQTAVWKEEKASECRRELPRMIPSVILAPHPGHLIDSILSLFEWLFARSTRIHHPISIELGAFCTHETWFTGIMGRLV